MKLFFFPRSLLFRQSAEIKKKNSVAKQKLLLFLLLSFRSLYYKDFQCDTWGFFITLLIKCPQISKPLSFWQSLPANSTKSSLFFFLGRILSISDAPPLASPFSIFQCRTAAFPMEAWLAWECAAGLECQAAHETCCVLKQFHEWIVRVFQKNIYGTFLLPTF